MGTALKSLTIRGFKSIERLDDLQLRNLDVLIGANGAGKSNFVDFFRMLRALADEALQVFVNERGGGDSLFFMGPKVTQTIVAHLEFGSNIYEFELVPTPNAVQVADERVQYTGGTGHGGLRSIGKGALESSLKQRKDEPSTLYMGAPGVSSYVYAAIASWVVYHFHDTSRLAPMRRDQSARDRDRLREDASNIAAFLLQLKETQEQSYRLICDTVRLIAPFFDDFLLRIDNRGGNELVRLEWRQRGSDFPFQPHQLSDGTIRFVCLATALLQPVMPATILIDEPELGLHPYAIAILADLIKSASERTQVIISTQSPTLLDYFKPEDIIVVSRHNGRSMFERLDADQLKEWLDAYSVGELWQKNVVRGGPTNE